jgi:hypothetical protein
VPRPKRSIAPFYRRDPARNVGLDNSDRAVGKMRYRLQVWRESSAGFVTLAGYHLLDRALEEGPRRGGHVRVVAGKSGRVVISWLNGKIRTELEAKP